MTALRISRNRQQAIELLGFLPSLRVDATDPANNETRRAQCIHLHNNAVRVLDSLNTELASESEGMIHRTWEAI